MPRLFKLKNGGTVSYDSLLKQYGTDEAVSSAIKANEVTEIPEQPAVNPPATKKSALTAPVVEAKPKVDPFAKKKPVTFMDKTLTGDFSQPTPKKKVSTAPVESEAKKKVTSLLNKEPIDTVVEPLKGFKVDTKFVGKPTGFNAASARVEEQQRIAEKEKFEKYQSMAQMGIDKLSKQRLVADDNGIRIEEAANAPESYYTLAKQKAKDIDNQLDAITKVAVPRAQRLGLDINESLKSDGTYQQLVKDREALDKELAPYTTAISNVKSNYGGNVGLYSLGEKITTALGVKTAWNVFSDKTGLGSKIYMGEVENPLTDELDDEIAKVLDRNKEARDMFLDGYGTLEKKESIIAEAKTNLYSRKMGEVSMKADRILSSPLNEAAKKEQLSLLGEEQNQLYATIGWDAATQTLKDNFKQTKEARDFNNMIDTSTWYGKAANVGLTFAGGMGKILLTTAGKSFLYTGVGYSALESLTGNNEEDEYSAGEAFMDAFAGVTNFGYLPSKKEEKARLINEDNTLNTENLGYASLMSLAETAPFTIGIMRDMKKLAQNGGQITNVIGQFLNPSKSKALAMEVQSVTTATRLSYMDYYQEAKAEGLNGLSAQGYAGTLAVAEGLTGLIMPDYNFFRTTAGQITLNAFKGNLKSAVTKQAVVGAVKQFGVDIGKEIGEEEMMQAVTDVTKFSMLANHKNSEFFNVGQQLNLVASTVVMSGTMGTIGSVNVVEQNKAQLYSSIYNNITDLRETFDNEINSGIHTGEQLESLQKAKEYANNIAQIIATSPKNVSANQIDYLVQRGDLIKKKEAEGAPFAEGYDAAIKELDQKIKADYVNILNDAITNTTTAAERIAKLKNNKGSLNSTAKESTEESIEAYNEVIDNAVVDGRSINGVKLSEKNKKTGKTHAETMKEEFAAEARAGKGNAAIIQLDSKSGVEGEVDQHIIINKENSLKTLTTGSPIHELFHGVLAKALVTNPKEFRPVIEDLFNHLKRTQPRAYVNLHNRLLSYVDQDKLDAMQAGELEVTGLLDLINEFNYEEVFTLLSEEMVAGRVNTDKSYFNKLLTSTSDLWGSITGKEVVIKDGAQLFDFISGYSNSVNKGRLSSTVERALKSGLSIGSKKTVKKSVKKNAKVSSRSSKKEFFHGGNLDSEGNLFLTEDKNIAKEYASINNGQVRSFSLDQNKIMKEEAVRKIIEDLGIKNPSPEANDELMLQELMDPRFDSAFSNEDIDRIKAEVRKQGFDAISYMDEDITQRSKGGVESIMVLNKEALGTVEAKPTGRTFTQTELKVSSFAAFKAKNKVRSLSAEDSDTILDNMIDEVEQFWGVLPDTDIEAMYRSIDYARDVISDRTNESSSLMKSFNEGLNLATIQNVEDKLNEFAAKANGTGIQNRFSKVDDLKAEVEILKQANVALAARPGGMTDQDRLTAKENFVKMTAMRDEIATLSKAPEQAGVSNKNVEISNKNSSLMKLYADPNTSERVKDKVKVDLLENNRGAIEKIVNEKWNDLIEEGGYNKDDFRQDLIAEFYELLRTFNPQKNNNFGAYLNKYLPLRANKFFEKTSNIKTKSGQEAIYKTELSEEGSKQLTADDAIEFEESIEESRTMLTEALGITNEILTEMKEKVSRVLRNKIPEIGSKDFSWDMQLAFREELFPYLQKVFGVEQAYKDFVKEKWVELFDSFSLSVMTQRRVDVFYTPLYANNAKGIKRLALTRNGDNMYEKNEPNEEVFLDYFIGLGPLNSTRRARKKILLEMVGSEIGFDLTIDLLANDKAFRSAFEERQEQLGKTLAQNYIQQVAKSFDRATPEIRYSKLGTSEEIAALTAILSPGSFDNFHAADEKNAADVLMKEIRKKHNIPDNVRLPLIVKIIQDAIRYSFINTGRRLASLSEYFDSLNERGMAPFKPVKNGDKIKDADGNEFVFTSIYKARGKASKDNVATQEQLDFWEKMQKNFAPTFFKYLPSNFLPKPFESFTPIEKEKALKSYSEKIGKKATMDEFKTAYNANIESFIDSIPGVFDESGTTNTKEARDKKMRAMLASTKFGSVGTEFKVGVGEPIFRLVGNPSSSVYKNALVKANTGKLTIKEKTMSGTKTVTLPSLPSLFDELKKAKETNNKQAEKTITDKIEQVLNVVSPTSEETQRHNIAKATAGALQDYYNAANTAEDRLTRFQYIEAYMRYQSDNRQTWAPSAANLRYVDHTLTDANKIGWEHGNSLSDYSNGLLQAILTNHGKTYHDTVRENYDITAADSRLDAARNEGQFQNKVGWADWYNRAMPSYMNFVRSIDQLRNIYDRKERRLLTDIVVDDVTTQIINKDKDVDDAILESVNGNIDSKDDDQMWHVFNIIEKFNNGESILEELEALSSVIENRKAIDKTSEAVAEESDSPVPMNRFSITSVHSSNGKGINSANRINPLLVSTDMEFAKEESKKFTGKIKSFDISENTQASEDDVLLALATLQLSSKKEGVSFEDLEVSEIIDPANEASLSKADMVKLFMYLEKQGFGSVKLANIDKIAIFNAKKAAPIEGTDNLKLGNTFLEILEQRTGLAVSDVVTKGRALLMGKNKGIFDFYLPPQSEDFLGLLYKFLPKGKKGEAALAFFKTNLIDTYTKGLHKFHSEQMDMMKKYENIKKSYNITPKRLNEKVPGTDYTVMHAVRLYLWQAAGEKNIFDIGQGDLNKIINYVSSDFELSQFADAIGTLTKRTEGYVKYDPNWLVGSIASDITNHINTVRREHHLMDWQNNVNAIFTEENLNKVYAAYGKNFTNALKSSLRRMRSGVNKEEQISDLTNGVISWTNGATSNIMFLNVKSALLQTLGAANFIEAFGPNNIAKASLAAANAPQFWADFTMLMKSDYLVNRRNGLTFDIAAGDIAEAASNNGGVKGALAKMNEKGFLLTKYGDSFAIASGGATFYRNYLEYYKKEMELVDGEMVRKYTDEQAHDIVMELWQNKSEETQQSSDAMLTSQEQGSLLGRIIFAFGNTGFQYARLSKRALQDIANGRGDLKRNIAKFTYYMALQNIIFSAMQSGLMLLMFGDDEDDDEEKKKKEQQTLYTNEPFARAVNGVLDTFLRGAGLYGAIASSAKNVWIKWYETTANKQQISSAEMAWELTSISPPINAKLNQIKKIFDAFAYKDSLKKIKTAGFSIDNPLWTVGGKGLSFLFNIPADRAIVKIQHLKLAMDEDLSTIQRVLVALGWNEYSVGVERQEDQPDLLTKGQKKDYDVMIESGVEMTEEEYAAMKGIERKIKPLKKTWLNVLNPAVEKEPILNKRQKRAYDIMIDSGVKMSEQEYADMKGIGKEEE
jgi:hypothetical protein